MWLYIFIFFYHIYDQMQYVQLAAHANNGPYTVLVLYYYLFIIHNCHFA